MSTANFLKKIKIFIGLFLYHTLGKILPAADCYVKPLGRIGKAMRAFCGSLILEKCGRHVNIYKNAVFSSRVELGGVLRYRLLLSVTRKMCNW